MRIPVTPAGDEEELPVVLKGDVDGNGVGISDAVLVAKSSLGIIVDIFTAEQADVTGDGNVNMDDAIRIARFALGIRDSLEGGN